MKALRKKLLRWKGTFRGLSPADSLLLYAGSTPRTGSAVWHRHPRNHVPHVHVEAAKPNGQNTHELHHHVGVDAHSDREGAGQDDHETERSHDNEHDDSHDAGHWHSVVPAERLRVSQELLTYSKAEIWITLHDLAGSAIASRPATPARAPPDCI